MRITTTFTGVTDARGYAGIFSNDGVHPSATGHAIIANIILDRIQADLKEHPRFRAWSDVAPVDERAVFRSDKRRLDSPVPGR